MSTKDRRKDVRNTGRRPFAVLGVSGVMSALVLGVVWSQLLVRAVRIPPSRAQHCCGTAPPIDSLRAAKLVRANRHGKPWVANAAWAVHIAFVSMLGNCAPAAYSCGYPISVVTSIRGERGTGSNLFRSGTLGKPTVTAACLFRMHFLRAT